MGSIQCIFQDIIVDRLGDKINRLILEAFEDPADAFFVIDEQ